MSKDVNVCVIFPFEHLWQKNHNCLVWVFFHEQSHFMARIVSSVCLLCVREREQLQWYRLPFLFCNWSTGVYCPWLLSANLVSLAKVPRFKPPTLADLVTYPIICQAYRCNPAGDLIIKNRKKIELVMVSFPCWLWLWKMQKKKDILQRGF